MTFLCISSNRARNWVTRQRIGMIGLDKAPLAEEIFLLPVTMPYRAHRPPRLKLQRCDAMPHTMSGLRLVPCPLDSALAVAFLIVGPWGRRRESVSIVSKQEQ